MKNCVIFANCQGSGLAHFLRKTQFAEHYVIEVWHNFQLILAEQEADAMLSNLKEADVFIYQPTVEFKSKSGQRIPSTDEILDAHIPFDCVRASFAYNFNHGFFPAVKHGDWKSGRKVAEIADCYLSHPPFHVKDRMFRELNAGTLTFDCALRFLTCLIEQQRRERGVSLPMAGWISDNFQKERLFNTENHPSPALYIALAKAFLQGFDHGRFYTEDLAYGGEPFYPNETVYPVSPQAVRELNLLYGPDPDGHDWVRARLEELMKDVAEGVKVSWQA